MRTKWFAISALSFLVLPCRAGDLPAPTLVPATPNYVSSCNAAIYDEQGSRFLGGLSGITSNERSIACVLEEINASTSVDVQVFPSGDREFTIVGFGMASAVVPGSRFVIFPGESEPRGTSYDAASHTVGDWTILLENPTEWSVPYLWFGAGGEIRDPDGGLSFLRARVVSISTPHPIDFGGRAAVIGPNESASKSLRVESHAIASTNNGMPAIGVSLSDGIVAGTIYFPTVSIFLNFGNLEEFPLKNHSCMESVIILSCLMDPNSNQARQSHLSVSLREALADSVYSIFFTELQKAGIPSQDFNEIFKYQIPVWTSYEGIPPAKNSIIVDVVGEGLLSFSEPGGAVVNGFAPKVDLFNQIEGERVVVTTCNLDSCDLSNGRRFDHIVDTILHEVGHALGLHHMSDNSVMRGTAGPGRARSFSDEETFIADDDGNATIFTQNSLYHLQRYGLQLPSTLAPGYCDEGHFTECTGGERSSHEILVSEITFLQSVIDETALGLVSEWRLYRQVKEGLEIEPGAATYKIFQQLLNFGNSLFGNSFVIEDLAEADQFIFYGASDAYEFYLAFSPDANELLNYELTAQRLLSGGNLYLIAYDKVAQASLLVGNVIIAADASGACSAFLIDVPLGSVQLQSADFAGPCTLLKSGGGTLTLDRANTYAGGTTVTGGKLVIAADNNLGDPSGALTLDGGSLEAAESLQTSRQISIGAAGAGINVSSDKTLKHDGVLSGAGSLALGGDGGIEFTGDMSGYTGTLAVNAGMTSIAGTFGGGADVNAGLLKVNGTIVGDLFLAQGARFTGNAQVGGNVINNGTIAPGNSYGTQGFLGHYMAGSDAKLDLEVWLRQPLLSANGLTHDTLSIVGDVSGRTLINIIPGPRPDFDTLLSTLPSSITRRGKLLVEVDGDVSKNAFALADRVRKHGFQYALTYVRDFDGQSDGFFLQARPRDELLALAALLSHGRSWLESCLGDKKSKLGASSLGFSADVLSSVVDDGTRTLQNFDCRGDEVDLVEVSELKLGVRMASGLAAGEIAIADGDMQLDGDMVAIEAFASFEAVSLDVEVAAGYKSGDWRAGGAFVETRGAVASIDVRRQLDIEPVAFSLRGGLRFDSSMCDDQCLAPGIDSGSTLLRGHAEARVEADFFDGRLRPYLAASYSEAVSGDGSVVLEDAVVETSGGRAHAEMALGLNASVGAHVELFADVRYRRDLSEVDNGVPAAMLGVSALW